MIEFSLIVSLLLFLTMGAVDFSLAFFQWNAATKAVQLGARLAAVSNPVASNLSSWTGMEGGAEAGDYPAPAFEWVCDGETENCTNGGNYDPEAMENLVFGRGSTTCQVQDGGTFPGMCDIFPQIGVENVIVRYTSTGLGYAGRPLGAVPTITVEVTGMTFNFMLLNGVLGLGPITMPRLHTTVTGEDLSTSGS